MDDIFRIIKLELKELKSIGFTGKVKFGVENDNLVSMFVTSKEDGFFENKKFAELESLLTQNLWGSFEFCIVDGDVKGLEYSKNFQGESLRNKIQGLKCKYVRVVAKK